MLAHPSDSIKHMRPSGKFTSGAHAEDEWGKGKEWEAPTHKLNYFRFSHASRITKYSRLWLKDP